LGVLGHFLQGMLLATSFQEHLQFPRHNLGFRNRKEQAKLMSKRISLLAVALLIFSTAAFVAAQTEPTTTVTKTIQNADGTYTVIEYPVGKETIVTLDPLTVPGAAGTATILRDVDGTRIKLNMTGLPSDLKTLNIYAVDPAGVVTSLGPVTITNGVGTLAATTPLNRFMLIASPEGTLTTYDPNTTVFFRSSVPKGFAVIPHSNAAVGESVAATAAPVSDATAAVTVPMLNIPAFKKGDDTKLKVNFTGAMSGARANVFIEPHRGKPTDVKMVFHELKDAPKGQAYILWAVSPDNQFVKLGQIVNIKSRNEAEIKSETTLPDFGLLVTMEDAGVVKNTVVIPAGPRLGVIEIVK
jgi:hypothetical protein